MKELLKLLPILGLALGSLNCAPADEGPEEEPEGTEEAAEEDAAVEEE